MISNDRELELAKEHVDYLRQCRDSIFERNEGTPFEMHLTAIGFERMMAQLQTEVDEYESRTLEADSVHRS
jgi:hypothetical protein